MRRLLPLLTALVTALPVAAQAPSRPEAAPPAAPAFTPSPPARVPRVDAARFDLDLQARALAPGVWVVEGANADFSPANGCNIINTGFIATGEGVLVINTGTSRRQGEQLRALIARTTAEPVKAVVHLNLHPDYFLGNQAFADVPRWATPTTRAGMAREARAYEDNLFRMCGDWMSGTEALLPDRDLAPPAATPPGAAWAWQMGTRRFELRELSGHTASDLVLVDTASGTAFVGGLAFVDRIPTTPHADLPAWLASLERLRGQGWRQVVPSHGPVRPDDAGLAMTAAYLRWLDAHLARAARAGLDLAEVMRLPVPAAWRGWAAFSTEYLRNVTHLYPGHERAAWAGGR